MPIKERDRLVTEMGTAIPKEQTICGKRQASTDSGVNRSRGNQGEHERGGDGRRVEFLDVGRGLSILGVMGVHTCQHFASGLRIVDGLLFVGQFGVQLFFAISAYTMCMTLQNRLGEDRRPLLAFLVRRFCRLAVPMWVAVIVYQAFAVFGNTNFVSKTHEPSIVLSTALLMNGTWPAAFSAVVPGGGSIATEALFYVAFPMLFLFRHRLSALALICIAVVLFDHSLYRAWIQFLCDHLPALAGLPKEENVKQFLYYGLVNQLPVFIAGMVAFALISQQRRPCWREYGALGVALMFYGIGSRHLAVIAAVCGLLIWALQRYSIRFPGLVWMGRRSYSLYLFHFAVLNGVIAWGPLAGGGITSLAVAFLIVIAGTCAIAIVTKPLLEDLGTKMGKHVVLRFLA